MGIRNTLIALTSFAIILAISGCTKKTTESDNSLNVILESSIKGLDPAEATDVYVHRVAGNIYEGLFSYHYLKRPLELIPNLAAAMPEVSKDGLTHTIKIKPGLKFADDTCFKATGGKGREVEAADFVYSWKRVADPALKGENFWLFDGMIVGFNEWRDKKGKGEADYATPIEGLQTPDKSTIVIKLKKPYYQLYYALAMLPSMVVPKEAVEAYGKEFLNHPVGTGPFKVASWTKNSKIILERNMNWRGGTYPAEGAAGDQEAGLLADAGKPVPFVDKVIFHEVIEDQPRWLNFVKGNVDFSAIPKDNFDAAIKNGKVDEALSKKGMKLIIDTEPDVTYTAFNMEDPVLGKNKYLRQAMTMASDHKTLIEKFYNGRASSAQGPIPPGVDGFDPNFKNPYKDHNLDKAKELMKKAGFPDGKGAPELLYESTESSTARQMSEFFQQEMAKIGIKIKISTNTWPEFQRKQKEKKAQIFGVAWMGDYPDAQNFLQLFYGPNSSPGSNAANYRNAEFDKIYEEALKLPPGAKRTELYKKMQDILVEDAPWIFNVHRLGYRMYHGWLKNYKPNPMIGDYYKYLRIDGKERAENKAKL